MPRRVRISPAGPTGSDVTEMPGEGATAEQLSMLHTRYRLAGNLSRGRDVLELACGPGIGLGWLAQRASRLVGGDLNPANVVHAAARYRGRAAVHRVDAHHLPFADDSFDLVVLLETIYFLPHPERFVEEARRVLRPGGVVYVCSSNPERADFNPSPYAYRYLSIGELETLLSDHGFTVELLAGFPLHTSGARSNAVNRLQRHAARLRLIPRSAKWKRALKRVFHGRLTPLPDELVVDDARCQELVSVRTGVPLTGYKIVYAIGRLPPGH